MSPPDPPEAGDPLPEPTPEKEPGQPIADCFRAIEEESDSDPASDAPPPERSV
jgi:hypothetical protein